MLRILLLLVGSLAPSVTLLAQLPQLILPEGHTEEITAVRYSPDGKWIITGSVDNTAKIWSATTGQLLVNLKGHKDEVTSVSFSKDGWEALTSSQDHVAITWDLHTGKMLRQLKGHTKRIATARYTRDGAYILTNAWDSIAAIWNAKTGQLVNYYVGYTGSFSAIDMDPSSKRMLVALNRMAVFDLASGKIVVNLDGHASDIGFARFSDDGKRIISSTADSTRTWDATSGALLTEIPVGEVIDVDPGWKHYLVRNETDGIFIYDVKTAKIIRRFDNDGPACFSPDGKNIALVQGTSVQVVRIETSESLVTLAGKTKKIAEVTFSPDSRWMVTATDSIARVWDVTSGKLQATLAAHHYDIEYAKFTTDGLRLLTAARGTAHLWETKTGKLLATLRSGYSDDMALTYTDLSQDGKKAVIGGWQIQVLDVETGRIKQFDWEADSNTIEITNIQFTPDGRKLITAFGDGTMRIWDAATGTSLHVLDGHSPFPVASARFSRDSRKLVTTSYDHTAKVWDVATGRLLQTLYHTAAAVYWGEFNDDGTRIVTAHAMQDASIYIWDANSGKQLHQLTGHTNSIKYLDLSPDRKTIYSTANDETVRIWDFATGQLKKNIPIDAYVKVSAINTTANQFTTIENSEVAVRSLEDGKMLYRFFTIDSLDYFIQLPNGYYQASPQAARLLHYTTPALNVLTFEQLDVQYNRPDKVLEGIGSQDSLLIKSYRAAYLRRIRKLAIDTLAFQNTYSVPVLDIVNRDSIRFEQETGKLSIHIRGVDSAQTLNRLMVWINEVPLFGQRGIDLTGSSRKQIDTVLTLHLSSGSNRIDASVINTSGTESYRIPVYVSYVPRPAPPERLYFVGIGIDRFADPTYNLQYSVKDIRDLVRKLKERYGDGLITDTLFNDQVTVKNVLAIKQRLLKTTINDKVIVSYSGHGLLSKSFDYYLSTFNVSFESPEQQGVAYDQLESLLDSIPARRKLMLIDACHSGEVDRDDLVTIEKAPVSLVKGLKPVGYKETNHLGLKNSFELMQELFVNVGKHTGATILSAAAGTQFALERNDLKNGVFTYCVLNAFNTHDQLTVGQLRALVIQQVQALTNGLQQPTSRAETLASDWRIW